MYYFTVAGEWLAHRRAVNITLLSTRCYKKIPPLAGAP